MDIYIAVLTMGNQANIDRLFTDLFWNSIWGRVQTVHVLNQGERVSIHENSSYHNPRLHYHVSKKNLGCAGGRKLLTEYLIEHRLHPTDAIVYLDDDVEIIDRDWLMNLVEPLLRGFSISGVAGRSLTPDLMTVSDEQFPDYVSGGWCAIRGDVFLDGCMFDEQFNPNYFEDVDLCFQARAKHKKIIAVGDIGLRHEHLAGASAADLIETNRQKFGKKWGLL